MYNEEEEERLEKIKLYVFSCGEPLAQAIANCLYSLKARGKGAPKKKRTKEGLLIE